MGILRPEDKKKQIRIEDVASNQPITYADYVFDDSDSDEDLVVISLEDSEAESDDRPVVNPIHVINYERRMNRRNARTAQKSVSKQMMCGAELHVKKNMGARKQSRIENARLLSQFADMEDIRFDCSDLVEETVSAFTRLMQNEDAMRAWNEFIEKDEKEQEKYLHQLDQMLREEENRVKRKFDSDEKRAYHPGYSAKTCFQRLDKEFKKALSKKSGVRLELIEKLETEFRKFFSNNPNGVWTDTVTNNQKLFYLRAVAQFLMLQSKSQQNANQVITEVLNPKKEKFEPPFETLHEYLSKKHRKGQKV